jgi:hypothetical protein
MINLFASPRFQNGKDSDADTVGDSALYPIYTAERGAIGSPVVKYGATFARRYKETGV